MSWIDGLLIAVLVTSAALAWSRGLVHEVLGVGAWIGAVVAAFIARPIVVPAIVEYVDPPWLADAIGAGVAFVLVLIVLKALSAWLAGHVQRSALGGLDRTLGILFGVARGAFLLVLAYIVAGLVVPAAERWPAPVREARFLPLIVDGARWLVEHLPPEYRPRLAEPALQPPPSLDEFLRPPARERS
jgi:membrane protein required for colicin V production